MCVHWQVYTVYPNDDKLVDLVTAFGDPFSSSSPPSSPSSTSSFPFSPRGSDVVESSPSITQDCDASDSGDGGIVKMYIRPHDGQLSNQPIAIDHERMVHRPIVCSYIISHTVHRWCLLEVKQPLTQYSPHLWKLTIH